MRKASEHTMCRFGEFQQPSPGSLGSPDSQLGIQNTVPEPVGAAEARDAEALNKAAARFLGQYLDEADEGPGIREQLAPMIEQVRIHLASISWNCLVYVLGSLLDGPHVSLATALSSAPANMCLRIF